MLKRFAALFLTTLLLCSCAYAACAQSKLPWRPKAVWVVYDGRVNCTLDDGTQLKFVVEYRAPEYDESAMKCFWLAFLPDVEDAQEQTVFIALGLDDHDLVFSDDGAYRLLIRESALQAAYEFWQACQMESVEE